MVNFYFELASVADWIVVLLTFVGVCIAGVGLCLAFRTVNKWKDEKEWEIWTESIIHAEKAYDFLLFIYSPGGRTNEFLIEEKLKNSLKNQDKVEVKWQKEALFGLRRHKNTIEETKYFFKKLEHLNNKPETIRIKKYYILVLELIEEWQQHKQDHENLSIRYDALKNKDDVSKEQLESLNDEKHWAIINFVLPPKQRIDDARDQLIQLQSLKLSL